MMNISRLEIDILMGTTQDNFIFGDGGNDFIDGIAVQD